MKKTFSVVAVVFMALGSFLISSPVRASGPEGVSIKNVTVRLEADSGAARGSRIVLAASRLLVELQKQENTSPTTISDTWSGQVELKEPGVPMSLVLVVSKIVTPGRYLGTPEDEVILALRVLQNGKEIGRVSSSQGSLSGITLSELGTPVSASGGKAVPAVTIEF